jgi:hypothetical protein
MLRNHMLGSANQRSTGQVRRRVSRMSAATLTAVRMALYCSITSGVYDIQWPYLWHKSVIIPMVCMALLCDLNCGICGIILSLYLWYLWHYLWWFVWHYSVALPMLCMALFCDITCGGMYGIILWYCLWYVSRYCSCALLGWFVST